ncbi:MAG TPA: pseudouridine synthase, partial [Sedimentisphaerales bacterium]|nr:pseudouridine synthase [Sedimentisphaerales bacterium]
MAKMDKSPIEVIYQDDDVIVVNKPSGISVTRDRSGADDLPSVLLEQLQHDPELRLVHRLDKDTSGVLVIARNLPAQSWLSSCFEKGVAHKTYLALVRGAAVETRGVIEAAIDAAPRQRNKMQVVARG